MAEKKKTTASRGKAKIHKNQRPHRPCPHCGQIQPGHSHVDAPHKPGGLQRRRDKRERGQDVPETREPKDAAQPLAPVDAPEPLEPIDAKTIIQGVVERIPAALESVTADGDAAPATGLNVAVRKAVLDEFRTRAQFAGRLAEIDALLWTQPDHGGDLVTGTLEDHLRQLRLSRLTEPEESDRFVVTEGEGDGFEVLRPAYVDELTGKVVLAGHLRRIPADDGGAAGEEA
ncbi:hypothetical protein [Streptomyces edwardsiae]|uniref:Uncharacterized protein n=1 Tax=Streptomyces edwardsiae TaxID=3075527 RepID=A0ABU2QDA2_9ACTN|nr:hypothetical protein [Streptomyces sp. DSM 41635]MDT0402001.1 hypothetical protein [Streptomyces sp. DSM 41635]